MGQDRRLKKVLVGKPDRKNHAKDGGVGVKVKSKLILGRLGDRVLSGLISVRIGTGGGFCEHADEPSALAPPNFY
jgi:hypothetical protein